MQPVQKIAYRMTWHVIAKQERNESNEFPMWIKMSQIRPLLIHDVWSWIPTGMPQLMPLRWRVRMKYWVPNMKTKSDPYSPPIVLLYTASWHVIPWMHYGMAPHRAEVEAVYSICFFRDICINDAFSNYIGLWQWLYKSVSNRVVKNCPFKGLWCTHKIKTLSFGAAKHSEWETRTATWSQNGYGWKVGM